MRQLSILVPKGYGHKVLQIAQEYSSDNLSVGSVESSSSYRERINLVLPNRDVGRLLATLEKALPKAQITLAPSPVLSLKLPTDNIPNALTEVQPRSPLEIFLAGVQSIGSWRSFLIYAFCAGVIVWIGLYTNSIFLLVASMLIAPFGGPAMNVAIASARGDFNLLRQSVRRYFVALIVMVGTTWGLSMLFGQTIATAQMTSTSEVSATAVLLPLIGGIAGALQLVQSERSSLVSGTAIGMLVAAALAPPAGLIGMAIAVGRFEMVMSGAFLLLLQLVGINLSCAVVFRLYGVNPKGSTYERGRPQVFPISIAASALCLVLLLGWQFSSSPNLTRDSLSQQAVAIIQDVVESDQYVTLVESSAHFTRSSVQGQNTLLSTVYVQPKAGFDLDPDATTRRLTKTIQDEIISQGFNVTPLVNVTQLSPPQ